jgi:hypothetical protein
LAAATVMSPCQWSGVLMTTALMSRTAKSSRKSLYGFTPELPLPPLLA